MERFNGVGRAQQRDARRICIDRGPDLLSKLGDAATRCAIVRRTAFSWDIRASIGAYIYIKSIVCIYLYRCGAAYCVNLAISVS
jgi:hypothetical protein